MPSSNKNWKPRFFFAWRIGEDGASRNWDVPWRWMESFTPPEPVKLSGAETRALEVLRATLREGPLAYTPPGEVRGERAAGEKRPRPVAEASGAEVLDVVPLAMVPRGEQVSGRRRVKLAKKPRLEESPTSRELRAAEEASVRSYEAEQAAAAREEEELRLVLRASAAEGASVLAVSSDSSGERRPRAGRPIQGEGEAFFAHMEAAATAAEEVSSRLEGAGTSAVVSQAEPVGAVPAQTEAADAAAEVLPAD